MFPKFLSGLIEIAGVWLQGGFLSGTLLPIGNDVSIGSYLKPLSTVFSSHFHNTNGELQINDLES